ncbi:MAG TPA: hypothetical protein VFU47_00530, partial [Armatimonadota bacterium]|nr:hypothetical protein [Armatimonadota bacterium]
AELAGCSEQQVVERRRMLRGVTLGEAERMREMVPPWALAASHQIVHHRFGGFEALIVSPRRAPDPAWMWHCPPGETDVLGTALAADLHALTPTEFGLKHRGNRIHQPTTLSYRPDQLKPRLQAGAGH